MIEMDASDRLQLATEVLQYCLLEPKIWVKGKAQHTAHLLQTIADPRFREPMIITRGTSLVAFLKKNKELWDKVSQFLAPNSWARDCKCKHSSYNHTTNSGKLLYCKAPDCKCQSYVMRPL